MVDGPNRDRLTEETPSGSKVQLRETSLAIETDTASQPIIDYQLSRDYVRVWQAMEVLVDEGKARAIGLVIHSILLTRKH